MVNAGDGYGSGSDYGEEWQDAIHLLKLVQSDYQGARKQLEEMTHTLAEREASVSQRLQYALVSHGGYRTLCLVPYGGGTGLSQIGRVILGEMSRPSDLPKLMRLEVRCLGRFEVRSIRKPVERWQSVKAKSVFQYLMARPREPVIKDMLMETLWPDCDPRSAGNNLKAAIHGLRLTFNQLFDGAAESFAYIVFQQGSYLMNPEIELWVDVEDFEHHWTAGRRLEREGKLADAVREFSLAEELYRGDYLKDEPYEEWTLLRREALKDIYITILNKLAGYSVESADYESCIGYCQKILAKDPCREDAYRQLMRCHSRLGQRSRALRWYKICRQTIQSELSTAPDDETSTLYNRLLRNESV